MKYLYYLLTLGALAVSAFHYAGEPFLPASALAAVVFAAVLVSLTLFFLRRRPGIAHGVVWGITVSGLAVELNTNMTHLLARAGLGWLGAAGYAPLTEEVLKFLGVLLICTCVIRPRSWLDYVFVGVAVGIGFTAGENATAFAPGRSGRWSFAWCPTRSPTRYSPDSALTVCPRSSRCAGSLQPSWCTLRRTSSRR